MHKINMKLSLILPNALPSTSPWQENFIVMNFVYSVLQSNECFSNPNLYVLKWVSKTNL